MALAEAMGASLQVVAAQRYALDRMVCDHLNIHRDAWFSACGCAC
jgi:hypothetical protein